MESERRPKYPCGCDGDDIGLMNNLTLGRNERTQSGCRYRNPNATRNANYQRSSGCACSRNDTDNGTCTMPQFADTVSLAAVYSPDHGFDDIYEPKEALEAGTLFSRLYKPFLGETVRGGCGR